jgi:hypothetical protein
MSSVYEYHGTTIVNGYTYSTFSNASSLFVEYFFVCFVSLISHTESSSMSIKQIERNGVIANGRLAQLLTEGTSPNPRWLIKFDGQPYKDEEMYERAFGKLIQPADIEEEPNEPSPPPPTVTKASAAASTATKSGGANATASGTSSEGEKSDDAAAATNTSKKGKSDNNGNNKKSVQFEGAIDDGDGSEDSSPEDTARRSKADRVSAREARSRRRQAKIDEEAIPPGAEVLIADKRKIPPPLGHNSKKAKNSHNHNHYGDGEVVKVKLLTGTLFLYRGTQRRVEFVRRV